LTVAIRFDGTATAGSDYTPIATSTVTFATAAPTATLELDAIADSIVEPNESVVSTVLPGTGYVVRSDATATATILNDDLGGPTVQVVFSGPVDVPVGPVDDKRFVVTAITGRPATAAIDVDVVRSELIDGQQIVTLKFAGKNRIEPLSRTQQGEKAMLVDGRYRLTIGGAALGIDANGLAPGHDSVDEFFRLFGDHDGDGDVDHLDYKRFLDFYADGDHEAVFNFHDHARHRQRNRVAFMKRFGESL
jgi:hypothetical protein